MRGGENQGNLRAAEPNRVIEFDMKHIRIPNNGKKYAMVVIDVVAKQAVITKRQWIEICLGKCCP